MKNKLILFDLDETLVSSRLTEENDVSFNCSSFGKVKVIVRNKAYDALDKISKKYEIGIFTASPEDYAQKVIWFLGLKDKLKYFCTGKHTQRKHLNGPSLKPLDRFIRRYGEMNVLTIDDAAKYSFKDNISENNVIRVPPFYGDSQDTIFEQLPNYIDYLFSIDFLKENKNNWWKND